MKKFLKVFVCVFAIMSIVGCGSNSDNNEKKEPEEKVELNEARDLPCVFYTNEETGYNEKLLKLKIIEIDNALKDEIDLKNKDLSADELNSLQDEFMFLEITIETTSEGEIIRSQSTPKSFFNRMSFVKGSENIDNSAVSIGTYINTSDDNDYKFGILMRKEYAEDKNVQLKYKRNEIFYFDIER